MQLTSQVKDYNTIKQKFSCKKSSQLSLQTCQKFLQDSAGFDAFNSQAKDCIFYFVFVTVTLCLRFGLEKLMTNESENDNDFPE